MAQGDTVWFDKLTMTRSAVRGAWMLPEAKGDDLVYASTNGTQGDVNVFTYPALKPVGSLGTLGYNAFGECVDKRGDVFVTVITTAKTSVIEEYAHGGTTPIATLSDPYTALSCSVDQLSGDLAVVNYETFYAGDIAIYHHAKGTPKIHQAPGFVSYRACGYDGAGNLFFDGTNSGSDWLFGELNKSGQFVSLSVDANISLEQNVQWDGQHITLSRAPFKAGKLKIYRLTIAGSQATVNGTTRLSDKTQHFAALNWIQGETVVQAYGRHENKIGIWKYPNGGMPTSTVRGAGIIDSVVVSLARK